MPLLSLQEMIKRFRQNYGAWTSYDKSFRDGHSTDPLNAASPLATRSITDLLNEAGEHISVTFRPYVEITVFNTAAGVRNYSVPADTISTLSLSVGLNGQRLKRTTLARIDSTYPRWREAAQGTPSRYFMQGNSWLTLYPTPSAVQALALHRVRRVAVVSALADVMTGLPEAYAMMPVHLAVINAAGFDSGNPTAAARGAAAEKAYNALASSLSEEMKLWYGGAEDDPFGSGSAS